MRPHYIGLMSGTSTDGVDGVLVRADDAHPVSAAPSDAPGYALTLMAEASLPLPDGLRQQLLTLNTSGPDELVRSALAANALADCYAQVVHTLLDETGLRAADVRAIGAHGQTVRHKPQAGYTIQINAPARLAEHTGIAVVADFRSRDVAAGGQGAPLVPAFHAACFGLDSGRVILNLGGIANVTLLDGGVRGFDTGPANMLMDAWAQLHLGLPYDREGRWAASGRCHAGLLAALLAEPWLALPPPKSTGRDLFNLDWLHTRLDAYQTSPAAADRPRGSTAAYHPPVAPISAGDIQATLLQLTVQTICEAVHQYAPTAREVLACGGGALNPVLMDALAGALPCRLSTTADYGIPVQSVEALAFAWLAQAHVQGQATCLPAVTGASHASVAGCLYPA
ncbi:anhydro-N-acetylmuramic acid kinase [Castellaniella sp.]|uniref:anhydro-N-acetylmuramic acid kinase n=1 Tax=Castellaniella sp. TaxID=1955812 RepID=UPI003A4C6C3A